MQGPALIGRHLLSRLNLYGFTLQAKMEAPRIFLEDWVAFTEAFWEPPSSSEGVYTFCPFGTWQFLTWQKEEALFGCPRSSPC